MNNHSILPPSVDATTRTADETRAEVLAEHLAASLGLTVEAHDGDALDAFGAPRATLTGNATTVVHSHDRVVVIDAFGAVTVRYVARSAQRVVTGTPASATLDAVTHAERFAS